MADVETRNHYRFRELLGNDAIYDRLEDVMRHYRQEFNVAAPSKHSDPTPEGTVRARDEDVAG